MQFILFSVTFLLLPCEIGPSYCSTSLRVLGQSAWISPLKTVSIQLPDDGFKLYSNSENISFSPSNEYSGLISFRIDWFHLLVVQGTLKSLLQHHSSKASILQHSAFFMVQLSHPFMTTGKTITLTIWTFVNKVTSLLFNTLSRFVIAFLPRSKHLLISRLQSPSTVILEHQ